MEEELKELHKQLMALVIGFFRERGITEVYDFSFTADELSDSICCGTWMPGTDSCLALEYFDNEEGFKQIELM